MIDVMVSNISWLWLVLGGAAVKDGWGIKGIKAGVCVWMMVFADVMFLSDVRNQAVPEFFAYGKRRSCNFQEAPFSSSRQRLKPSFGSD